MRSISVFGAEQTSNQPDEVTWNPHSSEQNHKKSDKKLDLANVFKAHQLFSQTEIVDQSPSLLSKYLSESYEASIYLKRENNQRGRTFKIRGAYFIHEMASEEARKRGFVVASDGNFGVSCASIAGIFHTRFVIFVPQTCFPHKLDDIRQTGGEYLEVIQKGAGYQECVELAKQYGEESQMPLLRAFDHMTLFEGFATIAKEIVDEDKKRKIDYLMVPTGGGGLACAVASVFKQLSPQTKVIAVQPDICRPYSSSILSGDLVSAEKVSRFCSGSSVKEASEVAVQIGRSCIDGFVEISERKLAEKIIKLYSMGFICEPAGALSIAGLDKIRHMIKGKNVVCILSGGNIDLSKLDEARQIAAVSKGVKNFYHIELPNRRGVMQNLITECFKSTDIISVQYSRRFGKETSHVLLSVESNNQEDVEEYLQKLVKMQITFENINDKEEVLDIFF